MRFIHNIAFALACCAMFVACQGPNDPFILPPDPEPAPAPGPDGGEDEYERVEAGVVRLFADKTTIAADGTDSVTFTVIYGGEDGNIDISEAGTTRLIYAFEGEEKKLDYGVSTFASSVAGEYRFRATAFRGESLTSDNEVVITVGGSGNNEPEPPMPTEGYMISVDKTTIEADGKDVATFIVTDPEGNNLMDGDLSSIYFKNVATGERLDRKSTGFSSVIDGEYEFVATYRGEQTANTVKIKVQNRRRYEKYKQRVAIYQLTGTWCAYCPMMVAGLEGISDTWKERSLVMAVHASSSSSADPYALSAGGSDLGTLMLGAFAGEGYPSCVYDLNELNGDRSASTIQQNIERYLVEHPATCGVKIASTKREGATITINAAVTSSTGGTYDLGYAILLDNQTYSSGTSVDGKYHDIVCAVSGNFMSMSDKRVTLVADEEHTREFTIENFPENLASEDLRVVVFALGQNGSRTITDNLAVCQMGGSAEYELN